MLKLKNLINNELTDPLSNQWIDNYNPSTGEVVSLVPNSGASDVDQAVEAAKNAFPRWSQTPVDERVRLMMKLADLIERDKEALAKAESLDQGKPLWLARTVDIPRGSANLRFFAHAVMNHKSVAFTDTPGVVEYINRPAIGPCALISPWNLPLYILTWKIAPCIATGNTAVCKPSELTPMTAYMLSELIVEAGFPPGVINIVHGLGGQTGESLINHPDIPVISFTGGTKTGAHIAQQVAPQFKKLSLELGGKNPNIVFADANIKKALSTSLRSSFLNQGEICLCGSRLFVERSVYQEFVDQFVHETDKLVAGDPLQKNTFVGALVSQGHLEKVKSYVELAREEGGRVLTQGAVTGLPDSMSRGYFMRPTVITGLSAQCRVQQEEIFGPVVTITPFDTEEEVIAMANSVPYGLSASLWTQSSDRSHRLSAQIKAGTVWVNSWMYRNLRAPLGGMKSSGLGREGGDYSLNFFTETQNISIGFS
jgi:aminomuconate-semialdehyde/2-hydroxymuconate-6-semialdehyde dehydrogenase